MRDPDARRRLIELINQIEAKLLTNSVANEAVADSFAATCAEASDYHMKD
jgi:hypothetical protein